MTRNALQELASLNNLRNEWDDYWKKARRQKSQGVDGISPQSFAKNLSANLDQVRVELLAGYHFKPLVALPFPKPDGRDRIICIPTVSDRLVQRALGSRLRGMHDRLGINNSASFGFLPSVEGSPKGVKAARDAAIQLRQDFPFAYKSDITSFFDNISREKLERHLDRSISARSLVRLLKQAMSCEIETARPEIARKVAEANIQRGRGVRQGMPLSPFFANLVLRHFDRTLIKQGLNLVRYADDFLILARSRDDCVEIDRMVRSLLEKEGFQIPPLGPATSKTQICAPEEPVDFLGLSLSPNGMGGYQLAFTEKQLEAIRSKLYRVKTLSEVLRRGLDISSLGKYLDGAIAGYRAAYPSGLVANASRLDDILINTKVTVFTAIFQEMFGPASLTRLKDHHRSFLCLDAAQT